MASTMGYVELMTKLLESIPRLKGVGHDRKLDMLQKADRIMSDSKKRIADYYIRTKDNVPTDRGNIDELIGDCLLDAVKLLFVLCEQKVKRVFNLAKYLSEAEKQISERRRKERQ